MNILSCFAARTHALAHMGETHTYTRTHTAGVSPRTHTAGDNPHTHTGLRPLGAAQRAKPNGFGIIELALILVVLGTLLFYFFEQRPPTGVSEAAFARDFVLAWVEMADGYKEKTGRVLGDGRGNGGWRPVADGRMDGMYLPAMDGDVQEDVVKALNTAGLDPCSRVHTAERVKSTQLCESRDIFQAVPGGRAVLDPPSGVGLARVFMPAQDRQENLVYFDHVPLEIARDAARLVEQKTGSDRVLFFAQPQVARWHGQGPQAPEVFTAQPHPIENFAATDYVRLAVIVP